MKRHAISALALTVAAGMTGTAFAQNNANEQTDTMNQQNQRYTANHELGMNSGVVDNESQERLIRAENVIGADIYTQSMDHDEQAWNDTEYFEGINAEWDEVGEVDDIVISRDGEIVGVIAEVGGWLDIGDADVLIDIADLKTVAGSADSGWNDLAFVTPLTEEQLESRQEVEDSAWW